MVTSLPLIEVGVHDAVLLFYVFEKGGKGFMSKEAFSWLIALVLLSGFPKLGFADYVNTHLMSEIDDFSIKQVSQEEDSTFPGITFLKEAGIIPEEGKIKIPAFSERFAKGQHQFGVTLGYGATFNLPPVTTVGTNRTKIKFLYFFPNFKYNLTGMIGKSYYRGALYWVVEAGAAVSILETKRDGVVLDDAPTYVFGITPLQLEYKFLSPERKWAPFAFAGVGFSVGNWHKAAREISTAFEFILQFGAGIEYFLDNGKSINFNYRFWHLSNSDIKTPNTGLNAHIFSFGFSF